MIGIWYFVIYALIILILWAFEKSRKLLKTNLTELITSASAYIYLLSDIKSQSDDILFYNYSWKDCNLILIIIGSTVFLLGEHVFQLSITGYFFKALIQVVMIFAM